MMTLFGDLPAELYAAIVEQVPDEDVKNTVLSLSRTFPSTAAQTESLLRQSSERLPQRNIRDFFEPASQLLDYSRINLYCVKDQPLFHILEAY